MESSALSIALVFVAILLVLYGYMKSFHNQWDTKYIQEESRKRRKKDSEGTNTTQEAKDAFNSEIPDLPVPSLVLGHSKLLLGKPYYVGQQEIAAKYGRLVPLYVGNMPYLLMSDVTMIKEVYHDLADVFQNRSGNIQVRETVGLVFARGKIWKRMRRTVSPTFSLSRMKPMASVMNAKAKLLCARIDEQLSAKEFDVHSLVNMLTLDVIAETAFATNLKALEKDKDSIGAKLIDIANTLFSATGGRMKPIQQLIIRAMPMSWRKTFATWQRPELSKGIDFLDAHSLSMIHKRRQEHQEKGAPAVARDFLDLLMVAKDSETDQSLTDIEIRDQCNTFLLAGSDTTSNTLSYAIYLLSQNPDAEEKLVEELNKTIADKIATNDIKFDDLKPLHYLDAVLKEAQRLYPAVAIIGREASQAVTLPTSGIHIPKGAEVQVPIWAVHHDPVYWENPYKFKPERFLNPDGTEAPLPLAFIPFGAGPRSCIGMKFAQMEAKLVLAILYYNFHFELTRPSQAHPNLKIRAGITLCPEEGVWVTATRRSKPNVHYI